MVVRKKRKLQRRERRLLGAVGCSAAFWSWGAGVLRQKDGGGFLGVVGARVGSS